MTQHIAFRIGRQRVAAIIALAAMAAAACGESAPEATEPVGGPALQVTVVTVQTVSVQDRFEAGGTVSAAATAAIASRILAPITAVHVRAGDRVRSGNVLVTLDAGDMDARARQADASVQAAQHALDAATSEQAAAVAERRLADAWHTRIARLAKQRSATAQELDEAEARRASSSARVDGARARLEQSAAQLTAARSAADAARAAQAYTTITAPFDGLVTERLVDPGTVATPGMPLLRLDADGASRIEARLDESRSRFVNVGDQAEVLLDDGGEGRPAEATVTEVGRAVDASSRTFTVKVGLPRGVAPRSGSFARVRFRGPARTIVAVPREAVRRNGQLTSVFVVSNGVARLRLVQTGAEDEGRVEIVAGLDAGETIVTAASPALMDGHRVTGGAP